jgi:hypothetical protein
MNAAEVVAFLSPSRISSYKALWAQDDQRMFQPGFVAEFPQKVYQHWRGVAARDCDVLQFNTILERSLVELELETTKFCCDIDIA